MEVPSVPGEIAAAPTVESTSMKDGAAFGIRPIRQDDEERMIQFHQGLSERSVYMRYFESMSLKTRTAHARLVRVCYADPERETVLVAVTSDSGQERIVAVGRLSKFDDPTKAEIALLVLDGFQGRGLGSELLRLLIEAAREQKITQIEGEVLRDNLAMQKLMKKFGFRQRLIDPGCVRAVLEL
jgi:acetyltransferase